jgi:hypothetical protein
MRYLWVVGLLLCCGCFSQLSSILTGDSFMTEMNENLPNGEDPSEYRKETENLEKQGKYAEALDRHIWFHNNSRDAVGMGGVRLSYALTDWLELGEVYPPALVAFTNTRDEKTQTLMKGKGGFEDFHEVSSFNEYLDDNKKTLELFLYIDKNHPTLAEECWIAAEDVLLKAKDYTLIKKYIPSLLDEFREAKSFYRLNVKLSKDSDFGDEHLEWSTNTFVEDCLSLIEISVAIDDLESAQNIQRLAIQVVDDERLHKASLDKAESKE